VILAGLILPRLVLYGWTVIGIDRARGCRVLLTWRSVCVLVALMSGMQQARLIVFPVNRVGLARYGGVAGSIPALGTVTNSGDLNR